MNFTSEAKLRITEIAERQANKSRLDEVERLEPRAELADHLRALSEDLALAEGAPEVGIRHVEAAWARLAGEADAAFFASRRIRRPQGWRGWLGLSLALLAVVATLPMIAPTACQQTLSGSEECQTSWHPLGIMVMGASALACLGVLFRARTAPMVAALVTLLMLPFATGPAYTLVVPALLLASGLAMPVHNSPRGLPAPSRPMRWVRRAGYLIAGVVAFPLALNWEWLGAGGFAALFATALTIAVALGGMLALVLREKAPRALIVAGSLVAVGLMAGFIGMVATFIALQDGPRCSDHPYAVAWTDPALPRILETQARNFGGTWVGFPNDNTTDGYLSTKYGPGNATVESLQLFVSLGRADDGITLEWRSGKATAQWSSRLTDNFVRQQAERFATEGFAFDSAAAASWAQQFWQARQSAGEYQDERGSSTLFVSELRLAAPVQFSRIFTAEPAPTQTPDAGTVVFRGDDWTANVALARFERKTPTDLLRVDVKGVAYYEWTDQVDGDLGFVARQRIQGIGLDATRMQTSTLVLSSGPQCTHGD